MDLKAAFHLMACTGRRIQQTRLQGSAVLHPRDPGRGIITQSLPLLRQTTLADMRQRAHAAALHLAYAG